MVLQQYVPNTNPGAVMNHEHVRGSALANLIAIVSVACAIAVLYLPLLMG